ncbi:hypothetical protein NIES4071_64810 [Calothrix sp. NIES-4071]|nr:hypothetical protein NIES4071_64810 [Calothrix sp. NIES-4071]BAZ60785.1 hypothetical protein NIES4105_64770 [Calothrix sp. NIES-4105]
MDTQITLNLPSSVYDKAKHLAQLTNRDIADVLTQAITLSLLPITPKEAPTKNLENFSINSLPDEKVIALTELQMAPSQDQRLSELLYNQQAGTLKDTEHSELLALMQVTHENLLLKANALQRSSC